MPQPPEPVHDFFARYLANPDVEALHQFYIDLLELEIARAKYDVLPKQLEWAMDRVAEVYRRDIVAASRILKLARRGKKLDFVRFDLQYQWLTLLGHRLATDRGLPTGGLDALAHVASTRLELPLKETKAWYADTLFVQYTQTVLREEWDYPGPQVATSQSAAPEAVR